MDRLIAVMPAYNEAENISKTIDEWFPVIQKYGGSLLVVDDGSKDGTGDIIRELMNRYPGLDVIEQKNSGHGPALINGYKKAVELGADWVFQTDSDGQTNPDEFDDFWKKRNEYDAVIGMRPDRKDGFSRKVVEAVLRFVLALVFRTRIPDANAPFRLMKAELVDKYIDILPNDYAIPNVMLTVFFVRYKNRVLFKRVSFASRDKGKNSMNIRRIICVGIKAVVGFVSIKKDI